MDDVASVAETLVTEFATVDSVTVMRTVCSCCDECDDASSFFLEQAARARLIAECGRTAG
jgi:hypothetical protein